MAGIPVAWGGMSTLHRILGESRLLDLVLSGRRVNAEEALRIGVITRYADLDEARASARQVASYPRSTLRTIKRQMQGLRDGTFQGSDDAQSLLQALRDPEVLACMQAYMSSTFKS
jgi:enoyl-CoA hydratase